MKRITSILLLVILLVIISSMALATDTKLNHIDFEPVIIEPMSTGISRTWNFSGTLTPGSVPGMSARLTAQNASDYKHLIFNNSEFWNTSQLTITISKNTFNTRNITAMCFNNANKTANRSATLFIWDIHQNFS